MTKKKVLKTKIEKEPVKMTLKEKIDETVDTWKDSPDELKKQLFGLVQRVLYPDQFCPECNDRLFLGTNGWSCSNCGYQRQTNQVPPPTSPSSVARPSETGKVPPQVEKMIQAVEEPRRVNAPTGRGKSIRELVDQMDTGGSSGPTPQDEAKVRSDRNVGHKINWV